VLLSTGLTPVSDKIGQIAINAIFFQTWSDFSTWSRKNLRYVASDSERFTIWHCGMGQPSARPSHNSIAQFCVWTNAQFEVTNDMMLTVSPLYLSLCKLQNYLHYSTFQFVLNHLFPNKNAVMLLYILGIVKIFCLIGASEFMFHILSQSKISSYILSLTVQSCRIFLIADSN